MVDVLLTFVFGSEFDEGRIRRVAAAAIGESSGTPGLDSKTLMVDAANCGAVHLYRWRSEDAARAFFTPDRIELITALYGVQPSVRFQQEPKTIAVANDSEMQPWARRGRIRID